MRESRLRPSTERLLRRSESRVTRSSRFLSFMRQPSSALAFCCVFSAIAASSASIARMRASLSAMPARISSTRLSCSAMSRSRRSFASSLLLTFARSTAASLSQAAAAVSTAPRRSLVCSLSMSFWCIRSVMLPEEAYRASSSLLAFSSERLACSYSAFTSAACARSLSSVAIHAEISFTRSSSRSTR